MKRESHENAKRNILSLVSFILLFIISLTFISAVPYLEGNKNVSPNIIYVGDSATITLTVNGAGDSYNTTKPIDVMLVIDNSCSMQGAKISDAKAAGNLVIDELIASDRAGMVSFNTNPTLRSQFTHNFSSVRTRINALTACGNTNIGEAINLAITQFSGSNVRALVLISDGRTNLPANARAYALSKAREASANNITIFTIGIGSDVNSNLMRDIATAGNGLYWHYPTGNALDGMFNGLTKQTSTLTGENIIVTDILAQGVIPLTMPSDCNYVWNERKVICDADLLNIGENISFSFNVFVYNASLTHLNEIAYVNYTNYLRNNASFILNNPNVTILTNTTNNSCVGNVAPIVTIASPVNGIYNNSLVGVRINATDSNLANVWYNLNGVNVSYNNNNNFTTNLYNGVYSLYAYANDYCGSLSFASVVFRVNTSSNGTTNSSDNTGPNVTIVSPANRVYSTGLILLNITAVDDVKVDSIWYQLDGVNHSYSLHYMNLAEGYHTIIAYANDSSGNIDLDGVTFLVNYSSNGTNPGNGTNTTHIHTPGCGHTHAPVNDFDYNETADSVSMDDNFVVALNYVNSSEESGFSMQSYLSGEENALIFNMILLIAIILLLLIIVLIGKKK